MSGILHIKPADCHFVGCLRVVRDRWSRLSETRAPVSNPEVRFFDRTVLLELNHADLQASESGDLGGRRRFYAY